MGHKLILVVVDLKRLDLAELQAGTELLPLRPLLHPESQRFLVLFLEALFLLVLHDL
jgi:hypothetical protein